jgi:hypothetical protein
VHATGLPVPEEGVAAVAQMCRCITTGRRDCAIEAVRPPMLDDGGAGPWQQRAVPIG